MSELEAIESSILCDTANSFRIDVDVWHSMKDLVVASSLTASQCSLRALCVTHVHSALESWLLM